MAVSETLGIDFVGSSAGLQDAVMASQRALQALNRDSSRMSFTLGRIMRTIVTPIAGVILSAFAAKRALADFTNSTLPGVNKYNQAMGLMRISMFRLSSAVGELLAPSAARVAGIITLIATNLEPLIRKLAATMPSIGAFFKQMGMNLLAALRPLMPTVFALIEGIIAKFSGISWGSVFETLKAAWNTAWNAILTFMAPIIVRLSTLIETMIQVVQQVLNAFASWFVSVMMTIADYFGITLPAAASTLASVVAAIQTGIIIAIAAMEIALQNMPLLFAAMAEAAVVAIDFIQQNWRAIGVYLYEVIAAAFQNVIVLFSNLGSQLIPILMAIGQNIGNVLIESMRAAWVAVVELTMNALAKLGRDVVLGIMDTVAKSGILMAEMLEKADPLGGWGPLAGYANLFRLQGQIASKAARGVRDLLPDSEIDLQYRGTYRPDFSLNPIPGLDIESLLRGMGDLPKFPDLSTNMEKMEIILQSIRDKFGPGIAALLQDAINKAPGLAAQILSGLPSIGGIPGGRADQFSAIAPLLFGSREAAMLESNQTSKNPLVPLQLAANAMTAEQLVVMRAQAKASARKARIANF